MLFKNKIIKICIKNREFYFKSVTMSIIYKNKNFMYKRNPLKYCYTVFSLFNFNLSILDAILQSI
jgi:hypothetical protein